MVTWWLTLTSQVINLHWVQTTALTIEFFEFTCEITFEIYHERVSEGNLNKPVE